MLKKDMEELLARREQQLNDMTEKVRDLQGDVKSYQDDARKHSKLQKHVYQALDAINGIMAVNCREIEEWHRHDYPSLQYAHENNETEPACPPITELYASLRYIGDILNKQVEEETKSSRSIFER